MPAETSPKVEVTPEERVAALMDEELRLVERLRKEFPNREEPLVLMGDVYHRRGDIHEAVGFWERALEMNPKRADVYDRMARLAFETDQFERAISLWTEALKLDPAKQGLHSNIARSLMRLGKYEESLAEVREEIEISGEAPLGYFLLGRAYQHLQDYERAKASYEKAVELQPNHMNAYYGLYNVCARLKEREKARQYLEKFKMLKEAEKEAVRHHDQITTDVSIFSKGLATLCIEAHELYRDAGNAAKIEELLKKAIELEPENALHMEKLVAFYGATNRAAEALTWCRRIQEIDPKNLVAQLNMGRLLTREGRFSEAEKAFQRTITLAPDHYCGYQELARLYLRTNTKPARAKELAAKAVELEGSADNYFVLGWACDLNGDPASATAAIEQAMALDPNNAKYRQVYQTIKRRQESK
jgi:tetratricopeptide (TPR) repeat protein